MESRFCLLVAIVMISNVAALYATNLPQNQNAELTVSSGLNKLSANFYKDLAEEVQGNLISSPFSLAIVLAMLAHGARGSTEEKLFSALNLAKDDVSMKDGIQSLIDSFKSSKGVDLRLANKIFTDNTLELKPEFQSLTENYFRSAIQNVDFSHGAGAAKTINDWAAESTNNKINDLFTPDDVQGAAAVLANAVYFKGKWGKPFHKYLTSPQPFHVNTQTTKNVDTMRRIGYFNFGEIPGLHAQYIEIPYEDTNNDNSMSMFIIRPKEIDGLQNVEKNLDEVNFAALNGNSRRLDLSLPKFKIESEIDLNAFLAKLGLQEIFEDSANFSGISATPLKVSKAKQKAFVNVNEEGTEAAAVTGVVIVPLSAMIEEPPLEIKVDRPFEFAIVHGKNKTVLFRGHVTSPMT